MAAENRCQSFYQLRIYHLTTGAICAPLLENEDNRNFQVILTLLYKLFSLAQRIFYLDKTDKDLLKSIAS